MRVLVTWGSKRGGTAGIGRQLAQALDERGFDVVAVPAHAASLEGVDAAVIGGALYANRWPPSVRRFVTRHTEELRRIPVWFFSSGPLDDSADRQVIPPTSQVAVLAERVGARGHVTFGGRLEPDARGFAASAMARTRSGDWRNPDRIRAWAAAVADEVPLAAPGVPVDHAARSVPRLLAHGAAGWALCTAVLLLMLQLAATPTAIAVHAIASPPIFVLVARHYFAARGARDPLPAAITWTAVVAVLDLLVVAGIAQRSLEMFGSIAGTWLPLALVFLASWATGVLMSTMPWEERKPREARV